jgi:hypothetical protein
MTIIEWIDHPNINCNNRNLELKDKKTLFKLAINVNLIKKILNNHQTLGLELCNHITFYS